MPGINSPYDSFNLSLIQQEIANNSEVAFGKLYAFYHQKLVSFAYSILHAREMAEEVVEDVFIKVWKKRTTIDKVENLAVYLYVSVKNTALNRLSGKARALLVQPYDDLDSTTEPLHSNPYELMISAEIMNKMNEAVEKLPPRCKMIFKLIREDGLKYKDVSSILNISVNTIDAQMAIAIKRICGALDIKKPQKNPVAHSVNKN